MTTQDAATRLPLEECRKLAATLERGRAETSRYKHNMTHEQILRAAARKGFRVSRQYRQDILRQKAGHMAKMGLLSGGRGKRYGDGHFYRATPAGLCVLGLMEGMKKND